MNVTPHDRADVPVPVDDIEEFSGVVEANLVEPAAGHRNRMVMQRDQRVQVVCRAQRRVERSKSLLGQMTTSGAGQTAVEQHDAPAAEINVTFSDERLAAQLALEHSGLVVIARDAHHRHAERTEHTTEMLVTADVVLHEIARHHHCINGPLARLRESERTCERRQRSYAAQRIGLVAEEMRISELDEADAHFQYSAWLIEPSCFRTRSRAASSSQCDERSEM